MFNKLVTILIVTVAILVMLGGTSVQAADNWYVYLYNSNQKELVRVNFLNGNTETFDLGLPTEAIVSSWTMGFSSDGSRIALCVNTPTADNTGFNTAIYLRDIVAEVNVMQVDLGQRIGCHIGKYGFSADGSLLTVSVANYSPMSGEAIDSSKPIWQLFVFDVATGEIVHELNALTPSIIQMGLEPNMPRLPEVLSVDADTVSFAAMPYGIGGVAFSDVYQWKFADNTLEFLYAGPRSNMSLTDTLPATGETVWLDYDPNLPSTDLQIGPIGNFNVVKMLDNSGVEQTIFHTDEGILGMPCFIAGGEQLAMVINRPTADGINISTSWITLDRQGQLAELPTDSEIADVVNAPYGYAVFARSIDATSGSSHFMLTHRTFNAEDNMTLLWSADGDGWEMIWHSPAPLGNNLTAFPAIQ